MSVEMLKESIFCLNTKNTSYVLSVQNGLLTCAHWGGKVNRKEDFAVNEPSERFNAIEPVYEECSAFGAMHFKETSLKVRFADGTRDFRYRVEDFRVDNGHLAITLTDTQYPLSIIMHYLVHEELDMIEKWREVVWNGDDEAVIERIYSGEYSLPGRGYQALNFRGLWAAEFGAFSEPVDCGKKVYESLHGLAAHGCNPFFAVHRGASEESGEVYFGALAYSGNFKIVVEAAPKNYLSILAGMSDTDFEIHLEKGKKIETPHMYSSFTKAGFTGMTHTLTAFAKNRIMPEYFRDKTLPVLYNSWYATTFDVRCDDQIALAQRAAKMGVELFVIDDGWFKGRNSDKAGLGDWTPDAEKFPNGLTPLIDKVKELGMRFGIWIEPEMANPDSDLFRAHPDWVLRYQQREILTGRNQYLLDMSNPEVLAYLCECFDKLLSENDIAYVKWDMNRYVAEMGSLTRSPAHYKDMWRLNAEGVYQLIAFLREKHPTVEFEACASGGGRVDYGAMAWFDEYWPSDNTDPLDRLKMQHDYSYAYPIKYMRAWLTDDFGMNHRKIPLQFAMHCAMCGSLGIGVNLNEKTDEYIAEVKQYVDAYKQMRKTVQFGALYRLKTIDKDGIQAVQYTLEKEAVLFVFLDHERNGSGVYRVNLRGLEPNSVYRYTQSTDGKETVYEKSGAYLMEHGIQIDLKGDYDSRAIVLIAD